MEPPVGVGRARQPVGVGNPARRGGQRPAGPARARHRRRAGRRGVDGGRDVGRVAGADGVLRRDPEAAVGLSRGHRDAVRRIRAAGVRHRVLPGRALRGPPLDPVAGDRPPAIVRRPGPGEIDRRVAVGGRRQPGRRVRSGGSLGRPVARRLGEARRVVADRVLDGVGVVAGGRVLVGHLDRLAKADRGGEAHPHQFIGATFDSYPGDRVRIAIGRDREGAGRRQVRPVKRLVELDHDTAGDADVCNRRLARAQRRRRVVAGGIHGKAADPDAGDGGGGSTPVLPFFPMPIPEVPDFPTRAGAGILGLGSGSADS